MASLGQSVLMGPRWDVRHKPLPCAARRVRGWRGRHVKSSPGVCRESRLCWQVEGCCRGWRWHNGMVAWWYTGVVQDGVI